MQAQRGLKRSPLIKLKVCFSIKAIFKNLTFLLHDVWRPLCMVLIKAVAIRCSMQVIAFNQ